MKRIIPILALIVLLASCQKEDVGKNRQDVPTQTIDTDVPELMYRTGGAKHLVSIDSEFEAYDLQLKARSIRMFYSLIASLQDMIENGDGSFSFADSPDNDLVPMEITKVLSFLLQLSSSATFTTPGIHNYTFTYRTVNGKGEPTTATAALFVPKKGFNIQDVPVLVVPLYGAIGRYMSPSIGVKAGIGYGLGELSIEKVSNIFDLLYEMMARCGYAILCPDGLGMGDNYDNHIMCTKVSAYAITDALLACRDIEFDITDAQWDGKTVDIIGMSEGGYTTMEACKVLQEEYSDIFNVFAAACVDGPYDVAGSMIQAMFNKDEHAPVSGDGSMSIDWYTIPVLYSLSDTYGEAQPFFSYKNALRNDIEGIDNFPEYVNDYYSNPTRYIDVHSTADFLKNTLGDRYTSNRSALSEQYVETILDQESFVHKYLIQCNAFYNWTPRMNLMLFHHPADDLIPADNAKKAIEAFRAAGSITTDITYFNEYLDVGDGTIHAGASFTGFFKAFKWLDKQQYGDRFINSEIELPDALMNIQIPALQ